MKVRKSKEEMISKDNWNNIGCIFAGLGIGFIVYGLTDDLKFSIITGIVVYTLQTIVEVVKK